VAWTPPTEGVPSATEDSAISSMGVGSDLTFVDPQDQGGAWRVVVAQEPEELHQVCSSIGCVDSRS
jgi:hypothetical protein